MGQRDLRRLLVSGAMTIVRWASRKGAPEESWLGRMIKKKPRLVVAVALANRTARIAWALMTKGGSTKLQTQSARDALIAFGVVEDVRRPIYG